MTTQSIFMLQCIKEMKGGEAFGDIALREAKPRSATVRCSSDVVLAVLNKEDYDLTVGEAIKK